MSTETFLQILALIVIGTALNYLALVLFMKHTMKQALKMQADLLAGLGDDFDEDLDEVPDLIDHTKN